MFFEIKHTSCGVKKDKKHSTLSFNKKARKLIYVNNSSLLISNCSSKYLPEFGEK